MKIVIPNRKKIWWWNFVHYNYFHKKLFKEYYGNRKKFTPKQIKKYHFYQWIDDIITLRKVGWYHTVLFKLEDKVIFKIVKK